MDNQKSTEGKGSDASREGLGSSIGKSQNSGLNQGSSASSNSQSASSGSLGSANASPSTAKPATGSSSGSIGGTSNASSQSSGNLGSQQSGSSAAGSSGSIGSSSSGNSALGSSGSSAGNSTGSSSGNNLSSSLGSSSQQSDSGEQSPSPAQGAQSGIKAAIANVSPDKLHEKIDKVAEGAQPLVDRLVSTAHAGVDRISGLLSGASDSLGQRKGQLGETYSAYSEKSTEYVKTNPGTALLVAGAVGFLLAKLLSGSDSNSRRSYRDYRD